VTKVSAILITFIAALFFLYLALTRKKSNNKTEK
jgi:hypothetical protein